MHSTSAQRYARLARAPNTPPPPPGPFSNGLIPKGGAIPRPNFPRTPPPVHVLNIASQGAFPATVASAFACPTTWATAGPAHSGRTAHARRPPSVSRGTSRCGAVLPRRRLGALCAPPALRHPSSRDFPGRPTPPPTSEKLSSGKK